MGKASRAKRRARALRAQPTATQRMLVDRVQQSRPAEPIQVVTRRAGRKISEVLMEFAEPWLHEARNDDQRRIVIGMAVLAWNMVAIPEAERWTGISPGLAEGLGKPAKAILRDMTARKLALYSDENRTLLDYEITGQGAKMRVDVIYSLSPQELADLKSNCSQAER